MHPAEPHDLTSSAAQHGAPLFAAGGSLLWFLLAALALGLSSLLLRASLLAERFGQDRGRRSVRWASLLRFAGYLLALSACVRWLLSQLSLALGLIAIVGLFALLTVTGTLRDAAGSLLAQLRYRLGEGDHIRVGHYQGQVQALHWDHLSLRAADGQAVLVPGRALLQGAVQVQPLREGLLLEREVPCRLNADALARLADAVAISPYRIPGTPMGVRAIEGGVQLRLYVWSRGGHDAAEAQVLEVIRTLSARAAAVEA